MEKTKSITPPDLKISWPQFIDWFNLTLKQYGSAISPLVAVTKGKRVQIQRLVNELGSKKILIDAVVAMAKSDFLNGRIKARPFLGSFPWMFSDDEILCDLANGKYDNAPELEPTEEERRSAEAEQRRAEQEERRRQFQKEAEEEAERRRRQREYDAAHAAKGDELKAIFAELDKTFDRFKPKVQEMKEKYGDGSPKSHI